MSSMRLIGLATALLLALPGAAGAAVTVGHSGWDWGNPLPQGNTIRALEFVGSRGYAAGDFGTVLRTDDAGATWRGIPTGITPDLRRIRVIGPDTVIIGGGCTLRRSDDGGGSFRRLEFTSSERRCSSGLASFAFPSGTTGYLLLEDGSVFRTEDGGVSFRSQTAVPGTAATGAGPAATPTDFFFTNAETGVAVTKGGAAAGHIYRTTDGAGSWTLASTSGVCPGCVCSACARGFNGVYFFDAKAGYAVGENNALLRTADGGATWSERPLTGSPNSNLTQIRCADALTCLIATEAGDRLLRTTDGGDTATAVSPSTSKIFAAAFASATRVVGAGAFGTTVVSNDAGQNYSTIGGRITGGFTRLRAESASTAFAAGTNGRIARTTDGGQTWTRLGVTTPDDVVDVSFPTGQSGYVLDSQGVAFRTANGGGSWQILDTGTEAHPNALLAIGAQRVLLVGPKGIRRSDDSGGEFNAISNRAVRRATLNDVDHVGNAVFAFGTTTLLYSGNAGTSWKKLKLPRRARIADVDFVTSRIGFLLLQSGRVYQTRNRGKRWKELLGIGTTGAYDLAFGDARNGWLSIPGFPGLEGAGFLLHTSDGGKTFRPQLLTKLNPIRQNGLVAVGSRAGFALTQDTPPEDFLFATDSGGDFGAASALSIRTKKKRLRKRGTVRISVKLSPADGGELVLVAMRSNARWTTKVVQVASNGRRTVSFKAKKTSLFIAQWAGDDEHSGDGTGVLKVRVGRR